MSNRDNINNIDKLDLSNIKLDKRNKSKIKKLFNNDITFLLVAMITGIGSIMMGVLVSLDYIQTICGGK